MPATVVIGGQWGDEGKGRVVDLIARNASIIARYSAGNNAGHTVINDLGTFALHVVPAGIFYPDKTCLIGNGMAVDPQILLEEIESLEGQGVSTERLFISDRAHVILPYHPLIDQLDEKLRGAAAIGTTGRGVGPAFADKVARLGIRLGDLIDPQAFHDRLSFVLPYKNAVLTRLYDAAAPVVRRRLQHLRCLRREAGAPGLRYVDHRPRGAGAGRGHPPGGRAGSAARPRWRYV